MCLSVYLGSHVPISGQAVPVGALGLEEAEWSPPALASFPYRYYLGSQGQAGDLGCSCPLAQHVDWTEAGPKVVADEAYSEDHCPFEALRGYVSQAMRAGKPVVLACDDSGGVPQDCSNDDYDHLVLSADMITPKSYLFADPVSLFPWRVFQIVP